MTKVFVEQPLALHGSANNLKTKQYLNKVLKLHGTQDVVKWYETKRCRSLIQTAFLSIHCLVLLCYVFYAVYLVIFGPPAVSGTTQTETGRLLLRHNGSTVGEKMHWQNRTCLVAKTVGRWSQIAGTGPPRVTVCWGQSCRNIEIFWWLGFLCYIQDIKLFIYQADLSRVSDSPVSAENIYESFVVMW